MYFEKDDSSSKINNTSYYNLFELDSKASNSDIRKAYKKLLLKSHPDKGGDPIKFQEIQTAYEVLSDIDKRTIYDKFGEEGLSQQNQKRESKQQVSKASTLLFTLKIQLNEAYKGVKKEIEIGVNKKCDECKAKGYKQGAVLYSCDVCESKGYKSIQSKSIFGLIQQEVPCIKCNSTGKVPNIFDICKGCNGNLILKAKKKLIVDVEKGCHDGFKYKFPNEGNDAVGYETGDVIVEIFLENNSRFERKGADLATCVDLSIAEALSKFEIELVHLDEKVFYISNCNDKESIQPGCVRTVYNLGMPFFKSPYKNGNLFISFNILIPLLNTVSKQEMVNIFHGEYMKFKENYLKDDEDYKDFPVKSVSVIDFDVKNLNKSEMGGNRKKK